MKNHRDIRLLKPDEVGHILGVTSRSVLRYCKKENGLPYYKIGSQYRFDIEDVLEYRRIKNK